jgi:(E)-4-hydroxy-3-methylbut-2-enyl-diphosphate synthase
MRKETKSIKVGKITIGGQSPISIQSMANTDTRDIRRTVEQIQQLTQAGCEIIRVAVPDEQAAMAIKEIKKEISIPLVADIHFDYRLAILAAQQGADKLRINPGNIGSRNRVSEVVKAAKDMGIAIRIGVNAGSLEKELIDKYGGVTPDAMVESALKHVRLLESFSFYDIVISMKASDIGLTVEAYRMISQRVAYPLHIGITEAGTVWAGTIKSSIGIGILLHQGIGDTIRVSLTGDPLQEVQTGWEILKALSLRKRGPTIISCPTCGRCRIDLIEIANKVEEALKSSQKDIKVAVMGCVVNGPGEAKEADVGIAGGCGKGILFKRGKIVKTVPESELCKELLAAIEEL